MNEIYAQYGENAWYMKVAEIIILSDYITMKSFYIRKIWVGKNGGKFYDGTDKVSRCGTDFGRAGDCVVAKVQFKDSSKRVVSSWASVFDDPN